MEILELVQSCPNGARSSFQNSNLHLVQKYFGCYETKDKAYVLLELYVTSLVPKLISKGFQEENSSTKLSQLVFFQKGMPRKLLDRFCEASKESTN